MPDDARVLVVDDDAAVRSLLLRLLDSEGWRTDVVGDAEQALAAMNGERFDLVLLDKNLPGMSGLDLLAQIKREHPEVEVVMMTAFADMASVLRALEAGVYDYLLKPFDSIKVVVHTARRALEKRRMAEKNAQLVLELRHVNERLRQINDDLERLVAERTRQLEQLTLLDDVTGLFNQRYLHRRLDEEHVRAGRYDRHLAVLMLDVDGFKQVNDSHDHLFGSAVLRRVGNVLKMSVREVDPVIRYGGDEFAVILPETGLDGAKKAAERIRRAVEGSDVGTAGDPYHLTVSVGISSLRESDAHTPQELLLVADRALYAAKEAGRNRIGVALGGRIQTLPVDRD